MGFILRERWRCAVGDALFRDPVGRRGAGRGEQKTSFLRKGSNERVACPVSGEQT